MSSSACHIRKWEVIDDCATAADQNVTVSGDCLAPDISESHHRFAIAGRQCGGTGDFAHFFTLRLDFGAGRGDWSAHRESGERPVHVAARPDALHNLLPDIASFVEVQGAIL